MKAKLLHKEAMHYSFLAKKAASENNHDKSYVLFCKAAELESKVAEFYFDKPDLEPTRSVLIRSAAFLNLKAGQINTAQRFIFFGLLNLKDEIIIDQLNDALEISISLKNMTSINASREYNYLGVLRQKSIHYVLEPSKTNFGGSVSLEMIKDFSSNFLKSIKSYASTMLSRIDNKEYTDEAKKEFEKTINPLITSSSYGSFKFSIANDYLPRIGEDKEVNILKSSIIEKYHKNIFINPLDSDSIKALKKEFNKEEINMIFRPLTKIKSKNTPYHVGYYDIENYKKIFVPKIISTQKKQLLPPIEIDKEVIGQLESKIIHKKETSSGKISKKIIMSEELKSYEFEQAINEISPKNNPSIILNEAILLNVYFDSENGFKLSFLDFDIESVDVEYANGLNTLFEIAYKKIVFLANKKDKNDEEKNEWNFIKKLINDPNSLKK